MAPTIGFFPVDAETLNYLRATGRSKGKSSWSSGYCKEQGLFRTDATSSANVYEDGLSSILRRSSRPGRPEATAGPRAAGRDERKLAQSPSKPPSPNAASGYRMPGRLPKKATVIDNGHSSEIGHGAVVIAAITSCTNTSNPSVMIAAGLLAKKAASNAACKFRRT